MSRGYSHIVIGAGAIGSAAAYWLAERGAERVLVVEQFGLVNTLGSSGDHSRIIRHAYHSSDYTKLTPAMFAAWRQIEERSGLQVYLKTGGLVLAETGTAGHQALRACEDAMDAVDIPYENLNSDEIRKRYPQWQIADDVVALYQEDGGLLDIRRSVSAHTSLAISQGAEFMAHTKVTRVTIEPRSVTVTTTAGTFQADHLIVAAASWLPGLMPDLGLNFRLFLTQEQVSYFTSPHLPEYVPEKFPTWLYNGEQGGDFYGFPVYGEAAVKVARDLGGRFIENKDRVYEGNAGEAEILRGFLRRHLPGAAGPVLANKTCVYDMPADRNFVLDIIPDHPHVAVFNGAGHAGKFASLVGQILADLTTVGNTPHRITPFRLTRPAITDPNFPPVFHTE